MLTFLQRGPSLYIRIWRLRRRQIPTYKDDPRTERDKVQMSVHPQHKYTNESERDTN